MPTLAQLQKAVTIAEKIQSLQAELDSILENGSVNAPSKRGRKPKNAVESTGEATEDAPKKRGPKPGSKRGPKKGSKRVLSPEAIEKIKEGQRKRWAKAGK